MGTWMHAWYTYVLYSDAASRTTTYVRLTHYVCRYASMVRSKQSTREATHARPQQDDEKRKVREGRRYLRCVFVQEFLVLMAKFAIVHSSWLTDQQPSLHSVRNACVESIAERTMVMEVARANGSARRIFRVPFSYVNSTRASKQRRTG